MYLSEIAEVTSGRLQGNDVLVSTFSTNTRELMAGQTFIALKGELYDGHDFLMMACEKKAVAAIISCPQQLPIPTLEVPNTRLALGQIAAHHRSRYHPPIIAVTGSCGKTTTKAMIASILKEMGTTLAPVNHLIMM
jgi:UDP-N-acetylmuramoyl-tripeptide--D-alanyl-D-alanine ligase